MDVLQFVFRFLSSLRDLYKPSSCFDDAVRDYIYFGFALWNFVLLFAR